MNHTTYRNIGICAHIDAGKTSLTERILFYTGKTHTIGEVHNGEALMDWMDQEKERGITICSAVTTVFWQGLHNNLGLHKINIIDTPGHVDFTAEVERSLRILDGVCILFCAVGGVQPQTVTIWHQVTKYNIPHIGFINKLDRIGSNISSVITQINNQLNCNPILLTIPLTNNKIFNSLIDLVTLTQYTFQDNKGINIITLNVSTNPIYIKEHNLLIEQLVEHNDHYLNKYLKNQLTTNDIYTLIRTLTITGKILPLFCGSALKNKGIQLLLDGIIRYLPSPIDIPSPKCLSNHNNQSSHLSALVFKTITDEFSGRLSFVRIYSGSLTPGDKILNTTTNTIERISKIIELHANKRLPLPSATRGDIVGLLGLKNSNTGHTLCNISYPIILEPITFPTPVISVSVCAKNKANTDLLFLTIKKYTLEDPTITVTIDPKTSKAIVSGMGELHLEIFLEKIKRLLNITIIKDIPTIAFKETITTPSKSIEGKYIKQSGGKGQYGHVILNATPCNVNTPITVINKIKGGSIPKEYIKPIVSTILDYCSQGVYYGYPSVGITFEIIDGTYHEVDSSETAFKLATIQAVKTIFHLSIPILLEPIMKVTITSPSSYLGTLISHLSSIRGIVLGTHQDSLTILTINSEVPMQELFNYSTILRSLTKGSATFNIEFSRYSSAPKSIPISTLKL